MKTVILDGITKSDGDGDDGALIHRACRKICDNGIEQVTVVLVDAVS